MPPVSIPLEVDPTSGDDQLAAVMAEWSRLERLAYETAKTYQANPEAAKASGIEPVIERPETFAGQRNAPGPVNMRAAWLRAAAKKVIPPAFQWQVSEMIGGNALLVLIAYEKTSASSEDPLEGLHGLF